MSDIPVDHHQTTIDALSKELKTLLDTFCSDAQQRFCLEQRVASQQQLQRIRQTVQHIRNSSEVWTSTPNSDSIRQSLMRTCVEMLDCYQAVCQHRRIRALPPQQGHTQQLTLTWQQLSQSFEIKAREQTNLAALFDNLKNLRKAWTKKSLQIEKLLTSLLVTYELRPGAYVVLIDRYNYHQLGLKRRDIGTRQLVFECSRLSRKEQMEVVTGICDRFASVFAQNAQHNLSQIEAQVQLAQLTMLAKRLRKLQDQIFYSNNTSSATIQQQSAIGIDNLDLDDENQEETDDEDDVSSIDGDIGRSQIDPLPPPRHHRQRRSHRSRQRRTTGASSAPLPPPRAPPFAPFRSVAPSLWYIQDDTGLHSIPTPSFVPSPWQWPDLLQVQQPYDPMLFGLIKRRRKQRSRQSLPSLSISRENLPRQTFIVRFKGLFSARTRYTATPPATMGQQQHYHYPRHQNNPSSNTTATTGDDHEAAADTTAQTPPAPAVGINDAPSVTNNNVDDGIDDSPANFACISVSNLCSHFCRTGRQFYEDVTSNAQLKHSQDGHILQEIGRDLVETYAAIQLEASRALMHRILTILQDITVLDHSQQHDDWETSNATPVPASGVGISAAQDIISAQQQQQISSSQPQQQQRQQQTHYSNNEEQRSSRIESQVSLPPA
ncbi:hypothetical protein BDC45DRAFT_566188 [Circinella umbellata]|nr:hypothetical protein BDC45DRAFT_566188 [Circinella umbellata]